LGFGGRLPTATEADDDPPSPSRLAASDELIEPSFERDRPHEAVECFFLWGLLGESESNDKLWGDSGATSPMWALPFCLCGGGSCCCSGRMGPRMCTPCSSTRWMGNVCPRHRERPRGDHCKGGYWAHRTNPRMYNACPGMQQNALHVRHSLTLFMTKCPNPPPSNTPRAGVRRRIAEPGGYGGHEVTNSGQNLQNESHSSNARCTRSLCCLCC